MIIKSYTLHLTNGKTMTVICKSRETKAQVIEFCNKINVKDWQVKRVE